MLDVFSSRNLSSKRGSIIFSNREQCCSQGAFAQAKKETQGQSFSLCRGAVDFLFLCCGQHDCFTKLTVKAWALVREVLVWKQALRDYSSLISALGVCCAHGIFCSRALLQVFKLGLGHRWQLHMQGYSCLDGLPRKGSCWLGNLRVCLISVWRQ